MFKRIKLLRNKNNLTQKQIADFLKISQSQYSLYESGKKAISVFLLSKLANFYNTSIDFIIEDTDEIKKH